MRHIDIRRSSTRRVEEGVVGPLSRRKGREGGREGKEGKGRRGAFAGIRMGVL